MFETLTIVLPIFLILSLGFFCAATNLLSSKVADGLSEFVFIVAIPILLFRTLATAPLPDAPPWSYWLAYFAGLAMIWLLTTVLVKKAFALDGQDVPIASFTASQSNTVFIGIPLILQAYGERGAVPMFLLIAVHLPITMTVATLLIESSDAGRDRWTVMLGKLFMHPILIGIVAGAAYRLTGFGLPATIGSATKLMADAAAPTALFALGMTLRRYGLGAPIALVGSMTFMKLILQPALVYVLAFHVLPMPPVWAAVAVLLAACPSGVNSYLLAQRYQAGVGLTSSLITVSTSVAVLTLTGWVWLVSGVR